MQNKIISSYIEYINFYKKDSISSRKIEGTSEMWMKLLIDFTEYTEAISLNKKLPDEILEFLSLSIDNNIRYTIASKHKLPAHLYLKLSLDKDESVRMRIALNKNTPKDILENMKNDEWDNIVEVIKKRLMTNSKTL